MINQISQSDEFLLLILGQILSRDQAIGMAMPSIVTQDLAHFYHEQSAQHHSLILDKARLYRVLQEICREEIDHIQANYIPGDDLDTLQESCYFWGHLYEAANAKIQGLAYAFSGDQAA